MPLTDGQPYEASIKTMLFGTKSHCASHRSLCNRLKIDNVLSQQDLKIIFARIHQLYEIYTPAYSPPSLLSLSCNGRARGRSSARDLHVNTRAVRKCISKIIYARSV